MFRIDRWEAVAASWLPYAAGACLLAGHASCQALAAGCSGPELHHNLVLSRLVMAFRYRRMLYRDKMV